MAQEFIKLARLQSATDLRARLAELDLRLPVDDHIQTAAAGSPLAAPLSIGPLTAGNRWCIHPMEGWDAQADGSPSELTLRRWENFGRSGAKLIWGGEAAAVQPEGRANPRQTLAVPQNESGLAQLLQRLTRTHAQCFETTDDLVVGLQLTHSGRFCRPDGTARPRIAYHHPLLDEKFSIAPDDDAVVLTDDEIEELIDCYVTAADLALRTGYQFVDIKSCHGYLLHEFLSAYSRRGKFGGDFAGRTRLLTTIIERVRSEFPELTVLVRLSVFDTPPYVTSRETGRPMAFEDYLPYHWGFGVTSGDPLRYDLSEPIELLRHLQQLGVAAVNLSAGSPYYNPHVQRPAMFPPSDGYQPPEDPLVGVVRQIDAARQCKEAVPDLPMVGSGYSYLQDFLPHVAQAVVREGWIDSVGLGRMVLAYPELPHDALVKGELTRKLVCRTFSDCTTAPRFGLVSGCFPLDAHYKALPEAERLKELKRTRE